MATVVPVELVLNDEGHILALRMTQAQFDLLKDGCTSAIRDEKSISLPAIDYKGSTAPWVDVEISDQPETEGETS